MIWSGLGNTDWVGGLENPNPTCDFSFGRRREHSGCRLFSQQCIERHVLPRIDTDIIKERMISLNQTATGIKQGNAVRDIVDQRLQSSGIEL